MINSNGVYVVGQLACEGGSTNESERGLLLDDAISLTVTQTDREDDLQCKTYSLCELKDLQSKLMLIACKAEKGKDEVERFVKVRKMPYLGPKSSYLYFIQGRGAIGRI